MTSYQEWIYLDGLKAPVYYLCGYVPGAQQNDALSQKLIAFKSKNYEARQFWLNHFLKLCQKLFVKDHSEIIIRALGHNEIDVDWSTDYKNPLSNLCYHAARETNSRYVAGMIHKLNLIPPLKDLTRDERWNIVKDNFALSQIFMEGNLKTFWFVDDIITTGATARATWKALLDWYPDIDFRVIALARTVRDQHFNINSINQEVEIKTDNLLREDVENYATCKSSFTKIRFNNEDTFFI